jgi:regulator of RNase E activity RraA
MENVKPISAEVLEFLRRTDTCTVSNAIEAFEVRMRNEGYIHGGVKCLFPEMTPVVGYAVTGRIRTTAPPVVRNICYYNRPEWWEYVAKFPSPKILVLSDMDDAPGIGAFFGEIHAQISKALGCVAYVSNGSVRDVPSLREADFQCFAGGVSVSHSYAHLVEFGEAVEIGSLKILPGDLLHGDFHGVQKIPREIAGELPETVAQVVAREAKLIRLCQEPDFSIDKLTAVLTGANTFQPIVRR